MKYYSDLTKKFYETEASCIESEKKYLDEKRIADEKKAAAASLRKEKAQKIEEAFKEMTESRKKYNKLLADFCKEYGTYHFSTKPGDLWSEIFESLF